MRILSRAARLAVDVLVAVARQLLPAWLIGSSAPDSHGSSRWAHSRERKQLGRPAAAERLHGDGVVLGWHNGRLLQSRAEDTVLLSGVGRSGKTRRVGVPTLLGGRGATVAPATKEELVTL